MPEFVGCGAPREATRIEDNARPQGLVRLKHSQMLLLPASEIKYSLDTTDRGGRRRFAKRWYRWFASPAAITSSPQATPAMLRRAASGQSRSTCQR